jgi:cardiolipin synthase
MNLPNLLTALRMALIPVFVLVYERGQAALALLIFLAASLTDCLDGYLARKWNQVTPFGKLFDPMADKLLLLSVLFCLARSGDIPWWMVAVMGAKELLMLLGSAWLLRRKVVVSANRLGKAATALFIIALTLVFPWHHADWVTGAGTVLLYAAVALSVAALCVYAWVNVFKPRKG